VIVRASNGRRRDYKVFQHVAAARARGLPVSLYTYCEPANNSPEFQADLLCGVAAEAGISKATTLWADIEEGAGDLRWFEDRFIGRTNAQGWPCDTYSGDYFWRAHGLQGRGNPWKAAYGTNDGQAHRPPTPPWSIWQYTSNPLDTNTADAAVIVHLFRGGRVEPPQPKVFEDMLVT
jgi:GH25 family lysozyme M1 (1,4-beta-N-acetylmuramidase)